MIAHCGYDTRRKTNFVINVNVNESLVLSGDAIINASRTASITVLDSP